MSASGEGPERLAEILREIIELTKTTRTNIRDNESREGVESASVQKPDIESAELFGPQCMDWINKRGAASGQETGEQRGHSEQRGCATKQRRIIR